MFVGTLMTDVLVSGNTSNLIYLEMCFVYSVYIILYIILFYFIISPLFNMAHRDGVVVAGWFIGSEDPGSIPGIPSPFVGPLMERRLKTSSDVPVSMSE